MSHSSHYYLCIFTCRAARFPVSASLPSVDLDLITTLAKLQDMKFPLHANTGSFVQVACLSAAYPVLRLAVCPDGGRRSWVGLSLLTRQGLSKQSLMKNLEFQSLGSFPVVVATLFLLLLGQNGLFDSDPVTPKHSTA